MRTTPNSMMNEAAELGDQPGSSRDEARGGAALPLPPLASLGKLSARSPSMSKTLLLLQRLARTDVTITLIGETGVGKSALARAVHDLSPRAQGEFVVLDCGGLPLAVAESELPGSANASPASSFKQCLGAFERAQGGTLYINAVDEVSLELQARLVRVLDTSTVVRQGSDRERPIDVRVIASSRRELEPEAAAERFRQDLYFRLAQAIVRVPPLRERSDDLELLLPQLLADAGRDDVIVSDAACEWLRNHSWPGNVRELKNVLTRALACIDGEVIELDDVQPSAAADQSARLDRLPLAGITLARLEQIAIRQTLAQSGGNKMLAARTLGIAVSTLYEKLRRY